LGVGARSAAAAPFRLLQVLEVDRGEGQRQTRRTRRSKFDEAKLQRFGQQAGSIVMGNDISEVSHGEDKVNVKGIVCPLCFYRYHRSCILLPLRSGALSS